MLKIYFVMQSCSVIGLAMFENIDQKSILNQILNNLLEFVCYLCSSKLCNNKLCLPKCCCHKFTSFAFVIVYKHHILVVLINETLFLKRNILHHENIKYTDLKTQFNSSNQTQLPTNNMICRYFSMFTIFFSFVTVTFV